MLLLAVIFLHPLWLAVRPFGDELGLAGKVNHVVLPWIELAWFVDLMLTAWLIDWLRPFPDPWRPVRKPLQTPSHTGFEAKLDPRGSWSGRALAAVIGTLTSTAGMTLWILLATWLDRESYHGMFDHLPVWLYVGLSAIGTAVLQGAPSTLGMVRELFRRPTSTVTLDGRVLRHGKRSLVLTGRTEMTLTGDELVLTDEGSSLTVAGDPAHLRWIGARVAEIEPRGDEADVPAALRKVAETVRQ
ncbi:MAG: hypothetical protein H6735_22860 [Alphaproteobacteria bacterium]|nr:hypothetical protein [Alphaproteobacteria bacterium]